MVTPRWALAEEQNLAEGSYFRKSSSRRLTLIALIEARRRELERNDGVNWLRHPWATFCSLRPADQIAAVGQLFTFITLIVLVCTLRTTDRTASTMERQVDLSERSWVYGGFKPYWPLKVETDGNASVGLTANLHNVGKSVAVEVRVAARLVFFPRSGGVVSWQPAAITKMQDEICEAAKAAPIRATIFPRQADVSRPVHPQGPVPIGEIGELMVIGCIDYLSAVDSNRMHRRTPFQYDVKYASPHGPFYVDIREGEIPAAELQLESSFIIEGERNAG